jgi:hypothetical protein
MSSPSKVGPRHTHLRAVIYIRQSTPQQVLNNQEGTRRQYQLVERARQMGWPDANIRVIDDDLGLSGASSQQRLGFQRLVAAIGLGEVGIVLVTEISRLSRLNSDWHRVIELCAMFRTLIADEDGIYDPTSRYPYPAEEFSARAGNGHRSGASALWADVRARLADKGTRPGQLRPGCLPRRHHAEDPDRGDEPAAGRTEHACEQAHAPRHPGAGTPRHPGRTA